jgi:sugar/nucleoside kinase (ribokinase family)
VTRILVVGDVVDDVVVRPLTGVTHASDTDAEIRRTDGGSAGNVAAWLGHLGQDVRFVGRAGLDGARRHASSLAAYGVDARISADPDLPTATLVSLLDPTAERTMYVDRAANATLTAADLPVDVLDGVGWLHLTGYSLFDDGVRPVVLDLVRSVLGPGLVLRSALAAAGVIASCFAASLLWLAWTGPSYDAATAAMGAVWLTTALVATGSLLSGELRVVRAEGRRTRA